MPVAVAGFLGTLLALSQTPAVKRALTAPGMASRLELPHTFRVFAGLAFLITMALGHLPALLAVPAGPLASRLASLPNNPIGVLHTATGQTALKASLGQSLKGRSYSRSRAVRGTKTLSSRSACPKQTPPPGPCSPAPATPSKHT